MREIREEPGSEDRQRRIAALEEQHAEHADPAGEGDVVYPSQVPTLKRNIEKFATLVAEQLSLPVDTCRADLMALLDNKLSRARQAALHEVSVAYRKKFWEPSVLAKIEEIYDRFPYPISKSRLRRYFLDTLYSNVEAPKTGAPTDWKIILEHIAHELLTGTPRLVDEPEDIPAPPADGPMMTGHTTRGGRHVSRGTKYKS
jgi:hypothetical protein